MIGRAFSIIGGSMKPRIEIYNKKTGHWQTKEYPDVDSAFEEYWRLNNNCMNFLRLA